MSPHPPPARLAAGAPHERCQRDNRDVAKRVQRQQIGITRYDHVGLSVYCQLEKFVVARIAAGGDALADFDQLGCRHQRAEPAHSLGIDQIREVRPRHDLEQLLFGDVRFEQVVMVLNEMSGGAGRGLSLESCADQNKTADFDD